MNQPRAIAGTYADCKLVKTRSVLQIIIEVPIQNAEEALHLLGFPQPGSEKWCAVALLDPKIQNMSGGANTSAAASPAAGNALEHAAPPTSPKRVQTLSQRAHFLTTLPEFWQYLTLHIDMPSAPVEDAREANKFLCQRLMIHSKREIDEKEPVAAAFLKLDGNFKAWQQAVGLGAI